MSTLQTTSAKAKLECIIEGFYEKPNGIPIPEVDAFEGKYTSNRITDLETGREYVAQLPGSIYIPVDIKFDRKKGRNTICIEPCLANEVYSQLQTKGYIN